MATEPFTLNLKSEGNRQRRSGKGIKVHPDITITPQQHDDLVQYITRRLDFASDIRDRLKDVYEEIDKEVAGWKVLDKDDLKRDRDNRAGKGPTPIKMNLQLTGVQLDEATTYLMSLFAPDDGIYTAIANKDEQAVATGFSATMNKHAKTFKHYRHMQKFCYQALKYNLAAMGVEWQQIKGNQISDDNGQVAIEENVVVEQGNKLEAFDMYNFLYDPTCDIIDLATKGEFFGNVKLETSFRIKKMEAEGEIFGADRFLNTEQTELDYFEEHPTLRREVPSHSTQPNWLNILSAGDAREVSSSHERVDFYCWINPNQFGLSKTKKDVSNKLQIWRFTLFQGKYIVRAEHLTNAHGRLPVCLAMPIDDGTDLQAPGFAEILIQLQRFGSHLLNIYQDAVRKKLFGITFYDKNAISLDDAADVVSGLVPAKRTNQNTKMSDAVHHINDAPETRWTLDDLEKLNDIMQKILPTQQQNQVANLERATQYQAAAVVQGSNRRNLKIAKLINDQAFNDCRKMQLMNIMQFQESTTIISDQTGETIEIDPAKFRKTGLEFKIADGLLGLDRLLLTESYKDLINMVIQNQVALQQIDMISLLDYFTNILGDKTDFNQFKIKTPLDNLPPQEKELAFKLLQDFAAQQQGQQGGGGQVATLPAAAQNA